jgi:hypothetical protein
VDRSKVGFKDQIHGDPKLVWELNRHQFLPSLGMAYFLTGEEHYAKKAISLMLSWCEQCPARVGINWVSGIELALRQISWVWTLKLIHGTPALTNGSKAAIQTSLYLQTRQIARNLSLYSSANNHLIAELCALVTTGHLLGRKRWVAQGHRLLEEQIGNQIHEDGVGAEQSPSYLAHTAELYLLAGLGGPTARWWLSQHTLNRLQAGAEFLAAILDESGNPPPFGDSDSGEILAVGDSVTPYETLINCVAHIARAEGLIRPSVVTDEKTFWLLGPDAHEKLCARQRSTQSSKRRAFPIGGCYILEGMVSGHRARAVFDCGPLGMPPMAGHGHADALSFVLSVDGQPVLIDPGTYTYYGEDRWRDYFRGTAAHNTVRIDGKDQSTFGGTFLAHRHAAAECDEWEDGRVVRGRHDGYERLKSPATHLRSLSFEPGHDALLVLDRIESRGEHGVEQFFHFEGSFGVERMNEHSFRVTLPDASVLVSLDRSLSTTIYHGNEALPCGWQSPVYGTRRPTHTLVGSARMHGTFELITTITVE